MARYGKVVIRCKGKVDRDGLLNSLHLETKVPNHPAVMACVFSSL